MQAHIISDKKDIHASGARLGDLRVTEGGEFEVKVLFANPCTTIREMHGELFTFTESLTMNYITQGAKHCTGPHWRGFECVCFWGMFRDGNKM